MEKSTDIVGGDLLLLKPSAFESEIHPSHKTSFYALCISPLQGAKDSVAVLTNAIAFEYAGYGRLFVNGQPKLSTHFYRNLYSSYPKMIIREEEAQRREIHLSR